MWIIGTWRRGKWSGVVTCRNSGGNSGEKEGAREDSRHGRTREREEERKMREEGR